MGRSLLLSLSIVAGCAVSQGAPPAELGPDLGAPYQNPPRAQRPQVPASVGGATAPNDEGMLIGEGALTRPPDTIYRDEILRATNNGSAAYLLRELQPEVYRPNGRFIGWRIGSAWPADPSLCGGGCDVKEGDIILTVNGRPVERPEQLSALIESISSMEQLEIQMIRDGTLRKRSFTVAERPR